jgi:hypothetical protein
MKTSVRANLEMMRHVALRLGELRDRFVFLGGAATALLVTDEAVPDVRPTKDVDVIVEVASLVDYHQLGERLRSAGFVETVEAGTPVCRWLIDGIAVDIMPTEERILGFSNKWYLPALRQAVIHEIAEGIPIRVVTAPFFLATKIEAFRGRGRGDFLGSHDMEDIVTVLDGRGEIVRETRNAPEDLRMFLGQAFSEFLRSRDFLDALPGHLFPDPASQQRIPLLMERVRAIAEAGG